VDTQRCTELIAVLAASVLAGCAPVDGGETPHAQGAGAATREVVLAPAPPFSEGQWPCSDCHYPDLPTRTTRRELTEAHAEIAMQHGSERMWCFDCHDVKDRDKLRLADGSLLGYEDAPELCAQCHGRQVRDWRAGAHGRRTGSFVGRSTADVCASCHSAHAPRFPPIEPEPPPPRPRRTD
jgi:hypothetical protein